MAADRLSGGRPSLPKAVLFDWDNTLVDNWVSIQDALNATLTAMGHAPWSLADVRARVRSSARETFPRLFGRRADEAMQIFYDRFKAVHLDTLQTLPGAEALLEAIELKSIFTAVVSNKHGPFLRLEAARNAGCVSVLVGEGHGKETAEADPDIRLSDLTALAKMFTTQ